MHETLSNAYANFAAIEPSVQQAVGLLLLSTTLGSLGAGMAVGGIWMRGTARRYPRTPPQAPAPALGGTVNQSTEERTYVAARHVRPEPGPQP